MLHYEAKEMYETKSMQQARLAYRLCEQIAGMGLGFCRVFGGKEKFGWWGVCGVVEGWGGGGIRVMLWRGF